MMKESPDLLEVPFMGTRDYLTGAEMFDAIVQKTGAVGNISFQMRSKADKALRVVFLEQEEVKQAREDTALCAFLSYRDQEETPRHAALKGEDNLGHEKRLPFDESQVTAGSFIEGKSITQEIASSYSFAQRAVALNKLLMNDLFPDAGKWIFSRIDLKRLPGVSPSIRMEFSGAVGSVLVKSKIFAGGEVLGNMIFSQSKNEEW